MSLSFLPVWLGIVAPPVVVITSTRKPTQARIKKKEKKKKIEVAAASFVVCQKYERRWGFVIGVLEGYVWWVIRRRQRSWRRILFSIPRHFLALLKCFSKRIISGPWDLSLLIDTLNFSFFLSFLDDNEKKKKKKSCLTSLSLSLSNPKRLFRLPIITDTWMVFLHLLLLHISFYVHLWSGKKRPLDNLHNKSRKGITHSSYTTRKGGGEESHHNI